MQKKIKITWLDILDYGPDTKDLVPTVMITKGILYEEREDNIIVSKSETMNTRNNKKHPEKNPNFYFIPKGLVQKIEDVN